MIVSEKNRIARIKQTYSNHLPVKLGNGFLLLTANSTVALTGWREATEQTGSSVTVR